MLSFLFLKFFRLTAINGYKRSQDNDNNDNDDNDNDNNNDNNRYLLFKIIYRIIKNQINVCQYYS